MLYIAPIVEGHGEVEAVPALLHRIAARLAPGSSLRVNPPVRIKSGSFLRDVAYFRKQVTLAMAKAAQAGGVVLILLDCEDDCPARLGPELLFRAQEVRADVRVIICLAWREYESWFLAAARSLRGVHGLPGDLLPPNAPDAIRNAKGWLGNQMAAGYDPIIHQLEFSRTFDLDEARANASFDRLYRRILRLLEDADDD